MRLTVASFALICLSFLGAPAFAAPITNLVVFGDSLSDNGNAAFVFQFFPQAIPAGLPAPEPPLYTAGRYTNGPDVTPGTAYQGTWVEQLAAKLGVADPAPGLPHVLNPILPAGDNLAVAGALTDNGSQVSIASMVGGYVATHPGGLSPTALYIVFGGSNDLFFAANPVAAASTAVNNIFNDVQLLYAAGARNFLVPNLPDLGTTPRAKLSGQAAALSAASLQFSIDWAAALNGARSQGINVTGVNLYSLYQQIIANPGAFGLTNVTDPAQGLLNADTHLFWDIQHPTTAGHSLIAGAGFDAINQVPEPATLALTAGGILAGLVYRRRRPAPRA